MRTLQTKTAFVLLATLASVAGGVGCGSSSSSANGGENAGTTRASLHRAKGCGDLLGDLKADASYKVNKAINRQIENVNACIRHYGDANCAGYAGFSIGVGGPVGAGIAEGDAKGGAPVPDANAGAATNAPAAPSASTSSGASSSSGGAQSASASSYSDTNTQVAGVDEADIVKNDGSNIYVLHGNAFKVISAWPATALKEAASIDIEGDPSEMFVEDGKVVVYSQVNGAAIFSAAGVTPKAPYTEYGYATPAVSNAGVAAAPTNSPNMAPGAPGGAPGVSEPAQPAQPYAPLTKITILTLNGTTPTVARETYYEGSYLDARRVGAQVRTVLQSYQYGPKLTYSIYDLLNPPMPIANPAAGQAQAIPYVDNSPKTGSATIAALGQLRAVNLAAIDATQLPDWLPYTFVKNGATISATTVACEDFYVPTIGSTQSGMTEVSSIDLANPGNQPRSTAILGDATTVYANADNLYVAANAWVEPPFVWYDQGGPIASSGGGSTVASPPAASSASGSAPVPPAAPVKPASIHPLDAPMNMAATPVVAWSSTNTHIHKFEFASDPSFANYVASGTVTGTVKDQFSLDDKDGFLRVATSENREYVALDGNYFPYDATPPENNNGAVPAYPYLLNHLYVLGQNGPWLDATGNAGDIAPNERLDSVRFVDTRGYLVTFRNVDPLFVFDLSQPKNPLLLASLTMNGFSEYMQPIDANHLLTIGRNVSPTGVEAGIQLQIFDVTDGAKPAVTQRYTYDGSEWGDGSEAEYDHKAFTYFADKGLLAFPYYSYNPNAPNAMHSTLEIFKVDVNAGFTKLGSIDSTPLIQKAPLGYCGGYFEPSIRRGVFLENFVYAVSYAGVVVRDSGNLGAPGAQVTLPAPELNPGYGPVCPPVGGPVPVPTPGPVPVPVPTPAPVPSK